MNTTQQSEAQQLAKDCDMEDLFERKCRAELLRLDAENEQLRAQLIAARGMDRIRLDRILELEGVIKAVHKFHAAKGRYHTQLAVCDLFDLCGLPNERPKK